MQTHTEQYDPLSTPMAYKTSLPIKNTTKTKDHTSNTGKTEYKNNNKRMHDNTNKPDMKTIWELPDTEEDSKMEDLFWPGNNKLK